MLKLQYTEITIDPKLINKANYEEQNYRLICEVSSPNLVLKGTTGQIEITCRDLALTAWGISKNSAFFRHKFDIQSRYNNDFNGGGNQLVEIGRDLTYGKKDCTLTAVFSSYGGGKSIYEADLIMDGRKDYHPTKNHGKHKFGANAVVIYITDPEELLTWVNDSYLPWKNELSRLSKPHSSLLEWVEAGLNMGVKCADFFCANEVKVIQNNDLKKYMISGVTLRGLTERFVCSKCGKRSPRVMPF